MNALRAVVCFVALGSLLGACGGVGSGEAACNGHVELCERPFDEVAYPTTHNAMSSEAAGWLPPNQHFGMTRQLTDGVRALMLDTYKEDELLLCHVLCELGSQPLTEGLVEIRDFLDANPNEIVSIIFESYIDHPDTASAFDESDLLRLVYAQEIGEPWPTLQALIDADTRLIVFQDKPEDPAYPWLMNIWDYAWETHFSWATPEDFNCDSNRGNPDNPLFILNHFLTGVGGDPELAEMVNYDPLFIDRALQCQTESGALPNFVTVDFYDIGDLFSVVDQLNGL